MVVADYFSRDLDTTDYRISERAFAAISSAWWPFHLDAFEAAASAIDTLYEIKFSNIVPHTVGKLRLSAF